MDAQIKYDFSVTRCNGIGVDFNGSHYEIIYGHYINGGFFSIINFGVAEAIKEYEER